MRTAGLAIITGLAMTPVVADPRTTGEEMPPLASPNVILDGLDIPLQIVTLFAPHDFPQAIVVADNRAVVGRVDDINTGNTDPDILVAFVGNWDTALQMAFSLDMPDLGARYQAVAEGGFAIDYTVQQTADGPLHIYTIAQDMAPYEVPTLCWARLIVGSLYVGGQPAPFTLRDCTESLTN